jgi:hypothetical protein
MLWYGLYHGNDLVVTNIEEAHSLFVQVILSVHDDTRKFKSEIHYSQRRLGWFLSKSAFP